MVRSGKEVMTKNRRNRRTVTVAAILLLLLAGVVGELTFGDRGGVSSAEAQSVVGLDQNSGDPLSSDAGGVVANGGGDNATSAGVERPSATDAEADADGTNGVDPAPGVTSGNDASAGVVPPLAPSIDANTDVTAMPAPASGELGATPTSDDVTDSSDENCEDGRRHGVDDHAVEHSDRHDESEAVSHGRDEEAHQDH